MKRNHILTTYSFRRCRQRLGYFGILSLSHIQTSNVSVFDFRNDRCFSSRCTNSINYQERNVRTYTLHMNQTLQSQERDTNTCSTVSPSRLSTTTLVFNFSLSPVRLPVPPSGSCGVPSTLHTFPPHTLWFPRLLVSVLPLLVPTRLNGVGARDLVLVPFSLVSSWPHSLLVLSVPPSSC